MRDDKVGCGVMTWLWSIPAATTLIGVAILWFGLRGRRVDEHPICRRCGFDLFGRPEGSEICSECGADLRAKRAMRDGRRVRRGWPVALGFMVLAVSLTVAGAGGYAAYTVTDWQAKKPAWWLMREMRGTDAAIRDAAIVEVNKRIAAGMISQAYVDAIADHALAAQADLKTPWLTPLGDFVESARGTAVLGDERWGRYVKQSFRLALTTRPRVRRGDPVPFVFQMTERRTATRTRMMFVFERVDRTLGGVALALQSNPSPMPSSIAHFAGMIEPHEYTSRVQEGVQKLVIDCRVGVYDRVGRQFVRMDPVNASTEAEIEVCHPAQPTVAQVHDEAKVNAMRQPIRGLSVYAAPPGRGGRMEVSFSCGALPAGIGYDVFLWARDNWRRIGSIGCPANTPRDWRISYLGDDSPVASVLFEPSVDAAARTMDTTEIWSGGQLTFTGVPVQRSPNPVTWNRLSPTTRTFIPTTTSTTPAGR